MTSGAEDDYGVWLRAEIAARRVGRLVTVVLVLLAGAAAYLYPREGKLGYLSTAFVGLAAAYVLGRTVEHLTLGFSGEQRRPASAYLAMGGAALAAAATGGIIWFFNRLAEPKEEPLYYSSYRRDDSDEWAFIAFVASVIGIIVFTLVTRRPAREISFATDDGAPESRAATDDHPLEIVQARLVIGAIAVAILVGGPVAADAFFEWRGLIPLLLFPIVALMVWIIALSRVADRARRERMAKAAAEVQGELADIRDANLREWGRRIGALLAGVGAFFVGQHLFEGYVERVNASATFYDDRINPGMQHWFLLIAAGVVTGLTVSRLLAPKVVQASAVPATTGGIFDDSVTSTGSVSVRQKISLMSLLFGSMSRDQYELLDGGQSFCASAGERSGFLSRLFLGGRRPIDLVVDDLGHEGLRLRRGFLWLPFFFNRAEVGVEQRNLGAIEQRLSLLRHYTVRGPDKAERYELRSGLVFRSRFKLLRAGTEVGELRRVRKPWYIRMITPAWQLNDRFSLVFPPDASLDDRKLLVGSVFLIDITHYPTQASVRWGALILAALFLVPGDAPDHDPARGPVWDATESLEDPGLYR